MPDCKFEELPEDAQTLLRAYIIGWLEKNNAMIIGDSLERTADAVIELNEKGFVKFRYNQDTEEFWIEPSAPGQRYV